MKETVEYRASSPNDLLIFALRDVSHVMHVLYEGKGSQKRVLMVLQELGAPITQRELTERLGIRPASASEVIAKLESAGCIVRTPSPSDRRTAEITLTELGKARASEARAQRARRHEEMFSCLTDEEKAALLGLLAKVNADWQGRYRGAIQDWNPHGHGPHGGERQRGDGDA